MNGRNQTDFGHPCFPILAKSDFAKPTLARKIRPFLANLDWPTLAKLTLANFNWPIVANFCVLPRREPRKMDPDGWGAQT